MPRNSLRVRDSIPLSLTRDFLDDANYQQFACARAPHTPFQIQVEQPERITPTKFQRRSVLVHPSSKCVRRINPPLSICKTPFLPQVIADSSGGCMNPVVGQPFRNLFMRLSFSIHPKYCRLCLFACTINCAHWHWVSPTLHSCVVCTIFHLIQPARASADVLLTEVPVTIHVSAHTLCARAVLVGDGEVRHYTSNLLRARNSACLPGLYFSRGR